MEREAREIAALGAGALRVHRGEPDESGYPPFRGEGLPPGSQAPTSSLDRAAIRAPLSRCDLRRDRRAPRPALRLARGRNSSAWCCWRRRRAGARLLPAGWSRSSAEGAVRSVVVEKAEAAASASRPGPWSMPPGRSRPRWRGSPGMELPLSCELHGKVFFDDHLRGRGARPSPDDLVRSGRARLERGGAGRPRRRSGAHPPVAAVAGGRATSVPRAGATAPSCCCSGPTISSRAQPVFPPRFDPVYPEVVLRGSRAG